MLADLDLDLWLAPGHWGHPYFVGLMYKLSLPVLIQIEFICLLNNLFPPRLITIYLYVEIFHITSFPQMRTDPWFSIHVWKLGDCKADWSKFWLKSLIKSHMSVIWTLQRKIGELRLAQEKPSTSEKHLRKWFQVSCKVRDSSWKLIWGT